MNAQELFIEFGGRQLTVASDDPRAIEYFRRNYKLMLAPRVTNSAGELTVMRSSNGYEVQGTSDIQHSAALDLLFPFLRREVLIFFIRARPDLLWLHAGAAERNGKAVLVAGTSGSGKSSIVTRLCERGWTLFSDENAPLDMTVNEVLPFPQLPRRRVNPGYEVDAAGLNQLEFEEVVWNPDHVARLAAPIRAIIFPAFQHGASVALRRLSSGAAVLEIIRNASNFRDHKAAAVERAVEMAKGIECYSVTYGDAADAVDLIDSSIGHSESAKVEFF